MQFTFYFACIYHFSVSYYKNVLSIPNILHACFGGHKKLFWFIHSKYVTLFGSSVRHYATQWKIPYKLVSIIITYITRHLHKNSCKSQGNHPHRISLLFLDVATRLFIWLYYVKPGFVEYFQICLEILIQNNTMMFEFIL